MNESERKWFDQRITEMAGEHGKSLTDGELRGYWSALAEFGRDVVAKVTAETTKWSRLAPRAYDLRERAITEINRTRGFGSDSREDDCEPATPEQIARVHAIVKGICTC